MASNSIKSFDPLDASLWIVTLMSSFMLVGIASFELFSVEFASEFTSVAGYSFSTAWILGYAAIVGTIVTNENAELTDLQSDLEDLDQYYYYAAIATLALPIAFVVFPETVGDFFQSEDLWGLVYVGVVSTGQAALGWML